MPELKILLRYVALLHHQRDGPTVFFPASGHDLCLDPEGERNPVANGNIELLRNGTPHRGAAVTPESEDVLIHLDRVAGRRVDVRPELLTSALHPDLNGRLHVAGGSVRALDPHTSPQFKGSHWNLRDSYRPTLTDTLEYSVALDDRGQWQLLVPGVGTLDISNGLSITLANEDRPAPGPGPGQFGDPIVLEELRVLYDLSNEPDKADWPVPMLPDPPPPPVPPARADNAVHGLGVDFFGPSRPMCVPAQSRG